MRGREAPVATKAGGGKAWVSRGQCIWKGRVELSSSFLEAGVEEFSIRFHDSLQKSLSTCSLGISRKVLKRFPASQEVL